LFLPYVPIYTLTGTDDFDDGSGVVKIPVYDENDLNPRKFLYLGDINISSEYKGSLTTLNVEGSETVTEMPLVYFDKGEYSYTPSVINYKVDTLSFGSINDLTLNSGGLNDSGKINILNENYAFQNKILNKPVFLEINMMLTPIDVQTVDFFTPIWLDFGLDSGYYYIDEISQYKGQDKATRVNLVKI
jgi:hypothetical protein